MMKRQQIVLEAVSLHPYLRGELIHCGEDTFRGGNYK